MEVAAKACKVKFESARKSDLIDSDVVFQGIATCEDSDGSRIAQYFIVPRRKGGFVMFSVQSNMKTEQARDVTKEEKLADSGYHLYYPSRRQHTPAFSLLVDALRYRG